MTIIATAGTACPSWCNDHTGFDDGSDDWHSSTEQVVGRHSFYLSSGTHTGQPEVFFDDHEGIPLEEAERLARGILALVEAAR